MLMIYIGKGIATVGVWAGVAVVGICTIPLIVGPFAALFAGVSATKAIWRLKNE